MLENEIVNVDMLVEQLRMSAEVAARAIAFWSDAGLIYEGEAPVRKRMSTSELARLSLENKEIESLLRESQRCLRDTVSHTESITLVELYEYEKISVEVLLSAIAYAAGRVERRRAVAYAKKVALDWKKAGIDTLEKAEAHMRTLARHELQQHAVAKALGISPDALRYRDKKLIAVWFDEYGYDETFAAEAALRAGKTEIPYLNAIIRGWHEKGCATLSQTRAEGGNAPVSSGKSKLPDFFSQALKDSEEDEN